MNSDIVVDKGSDTPVYRQIIERVTSLIRQGVLKPGDRLLPERELAERLELARGTVNRAYEELTRSGVLESIPGRGSFVSAKQDVSEPGRKERAMTLLGSAIDELRSLRFGYREMRTLFELALLEREEQFARSAIAVVDCNPETLAVFQRQLGVLARRPVTRILLDDFAASGDAERRLEAFDLVLTTARHYSEVLGLAPGCRDKLVQVALSPSQETIIALASVRQGRKVGILSESLQFRDIILAKLRDFMIAEDAERHPLQDEAGFPAFLEDKDVLVVPPGFQAPRGKEAQAGMQSFTGRGGKVIVFDYQVERGSMLYVEERVRDLLSQA